MWTFFMIFLKFCSEFFGLNFLQKFVLQTFFFRICSDFFLEFFQNFFPVVLTLTDLQWISSFQRWGGGSLMYALYSMVCDGIQWFSMVVNGIWWVLMAFHGILTWVTLIYIEMQYFTKPIYFLRHRMLQKWWESLSHSDDEGVADNEDDEDENEDDEDLVIKVI